LFLGQSRFGARYIDSGRDAGRVLVLGQTQESFGECDIRLRGRNVPFTSQRFEIRERRRFGNLFACELLPELGDAYSLAARLVVPNRSEVENVLDQRCPCVEVVEWTNEGVSKSGKCSRLKSECGKVDRQVRLVRCA